MVVRVFVGGFEREREKRLRGFYFEADKQKQMFQKLIDCLG